MTKGETADQRTSRQLCCPIYRTLGSKGLKKIRSGTLNSVKECRHLKPLLWKKKAVCMSYKTYAMGDLQRVLSEQKKQCNCTYPKS